MRREENRGRWWYCLSGVAYNDGKNSAMVNFHLPLPQDLHEELREEAERSGQPATALARDALRIVLAHRRRQRLHAQIAEFASEHAGSALDLDEDLERAAIETFKVTNRPALV